VIDYGLEDQLAMARRLLTAFAPPATATSPGSPDPAPRERSRGWLLPVSVLLLLLVASAVALGRRARSTTVPPVSAAYLRLRRAYARAGFDRDPGLPPRAFAAALDREGAPGARPAGAAVRIYTEVRFGGRPMDAETGREFSRVVSTARRLLRMDRRTRRRSREA
jgi:hypothetical protein